MKTSPQKVYHFIDRYIASNKEAPTISEIGAHLGLSSSASVHEILIKLENQGLIRRTPNISRGIEIIK